ncbi:MAG: LuxR C-terminal-related transcriptional regulator [Ferruginibacter sp.]
MDEAMDHCFAMNVIIVQNNKIVFKHELYRRTLEESLSPFKRIALNKMILELFLGSFEKKGEIERIVHYAKNANENNLVVKYAPLAAKQAAAVGAHIEAARLFLSAIEYYQGNDNDTFIQFYESYSYQCFLTNQLKDAIIYAEKSLKLLKEKRDVGKISSCMHLLSWYWWFEGNGTTAEFYATQAIELLADQPSSITTAMAFAHLGRLKMLSDQQEECLFWSEKAKLLAEEAGNEAVLCYVLNSMGAMRSKNLSTRKNGLDMLHQSLEIALKNNDEENIGHAWANLGVDVVVMKDFQVAKKILDEGIQFCEERDLGLGVKYLLTYQTRLALDTGNCKEALSSANSFIKAENWPPVSKIGALVVVATVRMRCGADDVVPLLTEAKDKAFETLEPQRMLPVMSAMLEYEWITGKEIIEKMDLDLVVELVKQRGNIYDNSAFAYWLAKARNQKADLPEHYEGYLVNNQMQAQKAAALWKALGCPYEQALALFEGSTDDKRDALSILQQLGADAVFEKAKLNMRAAGIKKIPRGLRESTKTNPAQLTNRELDVLQLLQKAVQNKEIAETLFISPKTVDHHISSILFKLDVNSRSKAVTEAVRLGIVK